MADPRDTASLDDVAAETPEGRPAKAPRPSSKAAPGAESPLVDINYPEPTPLAAIIRDVAKWSGRAFVMEPSLNAKLQIFAPRRMAPGDAYDLFLASLSVVHLRAVQVGSIVKIVPVSVFVAA